jgi:hypothetical protein
MTIIGRVEMTVCKTKATAIKKMPWAEIIIKVDGGYMGFESIDDYKQWQYER